jgi:hypothetical protein
MRNRFVQIACATVAASGLLLSPTQAAAKTPAIVVVEGVTTPAIKAGGGSAVADVVTEATGKKHIGNLKYEEISFTAGSSMGRPLYDWIKASFDNKPLRKNGSVIACDFDLKSMSEHEFFNALITEITIPTLDASDKDPAYMVLKALPEVTRWKPTAAVCPAPPKPAPKPWVAANFRFTLGGLDTSRVAKIDSFTIKQGIASAPVGGTREPGIEPTTIEFPNLKITLNAASAKGWQDWFEASVIKGDSGDAQEKDGAIEILAPDFKTVLARIGLSHVGIVRLAPLDPAAGDGATGPSRITADLYVERMDLTVNALP